MIEFIIIALVGSVLAGLWDLKTTEVPDEIPALMIVLGIFLWFINGGTTGDFSSLIFSLITGTILLAAGLLMYKAKQWGGADAWILAAIGYLLPLYNGHLFMIDFLPNFLIISVLYMAAYSIVLGFMNKSVFRHFSANVKEKWKTVFGIPIAFGIFFFLFSAYAKTNLMPAAYMTAFIFLLMLFWAYAKTIEERVFKRKIPVSKLKVGDVLEETLWVGVTEEQIREISAKHKFVTVKEGVRFVPVFAITLVVTLLCGNLLFAFLAA